MFQQVVIGQNSSPCVTVSNVIRSIDSRLHAVQFGMCVYISARAAQPRGDEAASDGGDRQAGLHPGGGGDP